MSSRRVVECDTRRKNWDSSSLKTAASSWHSESCWPLLERGSSTTAVKREREKYMSFFFSYIITNINESDERKQGKKRKKNNKNKTFLSSFNAFKWVPPHSSCLFSLSFLESKHVPTVYIAAAFDIIFIAPLLHHDIPEAIQRKIQICVLSFSSFYSLWNCI